MRTRLLCLEPNGTTSISHIALLTLVAAIGLVPIVNAGAADVGHSPPKAVRGAAPAFTGTVTDKSTGRPIANALVSLAYAHPRVGTSPFCPSCYPDCQKREQSDKWGRFNIAAPDKALLFTVVVARPGYVPQLFRGVDPMRGRASFTLARNPVRSTDPHFMIQGRVVGADGKPLAGAILEPSGYGEGGEEIWGVDARIEPMVITDRDGAFVFYLGKQYDSLFLEVEAPGLAPRVSGWLKRGKAPVTLRMGTGASLTGTVVEPSGKRLSGVVFEAVPTDEASKVWIGPHCIGTNLNGDFALPNVVPYTSHTVYVHSEGALAAANLAVLRRTISTAGDGTTMALGTFQAVPAATLRGRVAMPVGVRLPEGTRVLLVRDETRDARQVVLAKDGTFNFHGIPPGEPMTVTIRLKGYHLDKDTLGPDKQYPRRSTVHFTAPAAGVLPTMNLVVEKDARKL